MATPGVHANPLARITYWGPRVSVRRDLFDLVASPYEPPQYFEVVEVGGDGSIAVTHELARLGFVYLGVTLEEDPRKVRGAREITDLGSKPDLRSLKQLTVAYFG